MNERKITAAKFAGLEYLKGKEALDEAKRITKNFTLHSAPCWGITSYSFMYSGNTVTVFYNPG